MVPVIRTGLGTWLSLPLRRNWIASAGLPGGRAATGTVMVPSWKPGGTVIEPLIPLTGSAVTFWACWEYWMTNGSGLSALIGGAGADRCTLKLIDPLPLVGATPVPGTWDAVRIR